MPSFSEIGEMVAVGVDVDALRQEFLTRLHAKTKRPVLLYEANTGMSSPHVNVSEDDIPFLMDTLRGLKGEGLDLILHSNGGSPDVADMFVSYLRQKFRHLRVFVPLQAMSAATMIACGADEIVMGAHSFLGPIDMQLGINGRMVAAHDILEQYELIREDFDGDWTQFWAGPGSYYMPDFLIYCRNALHYGRELAERGLREAMFSNEENGAEKARMVAADLADHSKHRAHGRRLSRSYLRELGMKVEPLEDDQEIQDLVLSIHHCCHHLFREQPWVAKLVENHNGRGVPVFCPDMLMKYQGELSRRAAKQKSEKSAPSPIDLDGEAPSPVEDADALA